jgi:hypothetical protein
VTDIQTELRRLLIEEQGVPAFKVTGEARILQDLGVDGDDAAELFREIQTRFGTDLTALQAEWTDYFRSEPTILTLFRKRRIESLVPITVNQVVEAVKRGAW